MQPRALITGVTGQDGSYLCELLLAKGYQVHGIMRRCSSFTTGRIDHLYEDAHQSDVQLHLHYGDLLDPLSLCRIIGDVKPHEVYNLAAQSHVKTSFDQPAYTAEVVGLGTLNLLEAIRDHQDHTGNAIRFYQASSSEMYGNTPQRPQDETTPFAPASPYACAKAYAFWQTVNYRQAYNMFACNGILFNHESPRRGETFVTRKVTRAATRIKLGLQEKLYLGNLDASRDWGFAGDYVEAMWLMLQHDTPDDYVVATGDSHTVRQWLDQVFGLLDLDWHAHVEIDPRYFRPTEVDHLQGDARKIRQTLKWQPQTDFAELARMMTEADMETAKKEQTLAMAGYTV